MHDFEVVTTLCRERPRGVLLRLTNSEALQSIEGVELALAQVFAWRFDDAEAALCLAQAAVAVAERIGAPASLKVSCYAHVGNTRRILSDFRGAAVAFECGERLFGEANPPSRALLLEFRASLLESLRKFPEALRDLKEATMLRQQLRDREGLAKCLIQAGIILDYSGQADDAICTLVSGVDLVEKDRGLLRAGLQSLISAAVNAGRLVMAVNVLVQARAAFAEGGELFRVKLRWLEGRLYAALGAVPAALEMYADVQHFYSARHMAQEAALVNLDLALLLVLSGRLTEATRVIGETKGLLSALGIAHEARAAQLLETIVTRAEAAREIVREVAGLISMPQEAAA